MIGTDIALERVLDRVLLIEDDKGHTALIKRALHDVVGVVVTCETGAQAKELLQKEEFGLVLSDFYLPDTTGDELVKYIAENFPLIPTVVMTSSDRIDDAVEAMRHGAYDYMLKNFGDDFPKRLELVLRRAAKQRVAAEATSRLQAERDAFWAATRSALDGLATVTETGEVLFSNPAFNSFVQRAKGDALVLDVNVIDLVREYSTEAALALEESLDRESGAEGDVLWRTEIVVNNEHGELDHAYELSLASYAGEGSDAGVLDANQILWVRDITRRKENERFQRDLLSTTTHDLKGPLGAILTSAELLEEYGADKRSTELITRVASCARNCITLIDELLSARRIQDGVMVVKPRNYSVEELFKEVVLDYEPIAKTKDIRIATSVEAEGMQVFVDKIGAQRVLGNLVSNAIKFSGKHSSVRLQAKKLPSETVLIVGDDGSGIESDLVHRLFERYGRLEKHSDVPGTGLGLFVVKNIVGAHGGRIEVRSQLGVGTTFYVVFPDEPK